MPAKVSKPNAKNLNQSERKSQASVTAKATAARTPKAAGFDADVVARIAELAAISDSADDVTRIYLSPAHKRAIDVVLSWMRDAGMTATVDATGSVIGHYAGTEAAAPRLILGSHIDTVRNAGHYDGNLGVIAAIAVVADLSKRGVRMPFGIDVVAFGDEEGVRFPGTLGGSRALAGRFDASLLEERDATSVTRREALIAFGLDPTGIPALKRDPAQVLGYVEMHIEQGPVLEAENLPVGIVTAINGASRGTIGITGVSGHAGTVPMALRRDALAGAAEMILAVETLARSTPDLVATVGQLSVANGAVNTVPGAVQLSLDVRSPSDAARHRAVAEIERLTTAIAKARKLTATMTMTYDAPAAPCDAQLVAGLSAAVTRQGMKPHLLASGAGHDGMAFRDKFPFAMLFVRCRGGISHNPAEFASEADIGVATQVLADFVAAFSPPVT
jgi:allantoate deiminase